jgi:hypothetical protein
MATTDQPKPDLGIYEGERPVVMDVEHNAEQTLVSVDTLDGSVVAAVDVGDLGLDDSLQLARDVRDAVEQATSAGEGPAVGGEHGDH